AGGVGREVEKLDLQALGGGVVVAPEAELLAAVGAGEVDEDGCDDLGLAGGGQGEAGRRQGPDLLFGAGQAGELGPVAGGGGGGVVVDAALDQHERHEGGQRDGEDGEADQLDPAPAEAQGVNKPLGGEQPGGQKDAEVGDIKQSA